MGGKRKRKGPEPLRFIVVARTGSGPYPHPIEVGVHPAGPRSLLSFSIGPHVVNVGGLVAISGVLDEAGTGISPSLTEEFEAAELDWLVPFLIRLNAGEDVAEEIVAAYRERHGKRPDVLFAPRPRS